MLGLSTSRLMQRVPTDLHWRIGLLAALAFAVVCLTVPVAVSAAESAATQTPVRRFPLAQIFTFMFLMLGPFKIIAPFLKVTRGADASFTRQIAFRSTLFASLALLVAAFLGNKVLSSYGIPLPILSLGAGIILFLVALQTTLAQFAPVLHGEEPAEPPTLSMALTPLAFPAIVTPYGIASLVVFLEVAPDTRAQLAIGAVLLAIMLLNLVTMLLATRFMGLMNLMLPILGAILGVVQVALGLQIIYNSLKALGVL